MTMPPTRLAENVDLLLARLLADEPPSDRHDPRVRWAQATWKRLPSLRA
jgi:hypothetical protein